MQEALRAHDVLIQKGQGRKGLLNLHSQLLSAFRRLHYGSTSDHDKRVIRDSFRSPTAVQLLSRLLSCLESDAPTSKSVASLHETQLGRAWRLHLERRNAKLQGARHVVWEQRLSQDPLLKTDALHDELVSYATELLLCMACEGILVPDLQKDPLCKTDAVALKAVVALQHRVTVDADVANLVIVLTSFHETVGAEQLYRLIPAAPLLIRSLSSTLPDSRKEACILLDATGHGAATEEHELKGPTPFIMGSELCCLMIRSLKDMQDVGIVLKYCASGQGTGAGFLRWLGASIRAAQSPIETLEEAGLQPMLVRLVSADRRVYGNRSIAWDIFFLFLTVWNATHTNAHASGGDAVTRYVLNTPVMSDAVLEALARYGEASMRALHRDAGNVEMFKYTFAFIAMAFQYRPGAALTFRLDTLSEALIERVGVWPGMTISQSISDVELVPGWESARRTYVYARHIQNPVGTGWARLGGLSRGCSISMPIML